MAETPKKTAIIVGAGDFTNRGLSRIPAGNREPADKAAGREYMIIAADGGLRHLEPAGLEPDVIIGDFDSLGFVPEAAGGKIGAAGKNGNAGKKGAAGKNGNVHSPAVVRLPVEKDDTDMGAACRTAWEKGCRRLRIYGGSGNRPDHFLANLQLAASYSRMGGDVQLIAPDYTVYAVTDGTVRLESAPGITFSVFCHGDCADGVTIGGDAKYTLSEAQLTNTYALGVSNLMTGNEAYVTVRSGTLLIFLYQSVLDF